ncbi:hypothetical protein AMK26_22485 [Streptomyces sp. CB03234]|uniref:hypothetical protein n=1 Tax=Streptomyces sp. (strain CB03234) TaxID=1703937 RepID=UPI00093F688E|nr:hypothetical protein [Streptomyces sp. CB03234]OKK02425.1 hypothetical protein AMK26_22485 [Streptomyces sp. CB03234]
MRGTERVLYASGLPACWAAAYDALRPADALTRAVRHTAGSLDRMPTGYRWATVAALRLFPAAFYALTRRWPRSASPEEIRRALARLRALPGFGELLRATTALALYGALDGVTSRAVRPKEGAL